MSKRHGFHLPHFHLGHHQKYNNKNNNNNKHINGNQKTMMPFLPTIPAELGNICCMALESLTDDQLNVEGIHRVSSHVEKRDKLKFILMQLYEHGNNNNNNNSDNNTQNKRKNSNKYNNLSFIVKEWDVHEIIGATKAIFRSYAPLITYTEYDAVLNCLSDTKYDDDTNGLNLIIQQKLAVLGSVQCQLLKRLSIHFGKVIKNSKNNKMSIHALGTIWMNTFMRKSEEIHKNDAVKEIINKRISATERIINYFLKIEHENKQKNIQDDSKNMMSEITTTTGGMSMMKEEEEEKKQSDRIMRKKKDINNLSIEGRMLYNAVTNDNYNKCVEWLSNNVNNNPNAHDIILLVSEYVESNYLDTNQLTDMNGATKFILMTEVLTGFSNEEFTSFLSDSPCGPKFVEMAGRLSLAAEDAIINERDHVVETIQLQSNTTKRNDFNYTQNISDLEKQIKQLNERLFLEIENKKILVKQLEEYPPERIKSLQVMNERLETLLSQAKEENKELIGRNERVNGEFELKKLQALGQMEAKHRVEMKKQVGKAKVDMEREIKKMIEKHKEEMKELVEKHKQEMDIVKGEHEEALLALAEIHQDRLQEAEMDKLRALGVAEAKHKDIQKRLRKEIKRTRLNSNERSSSMKTEHVRMIADMETAHRTAVQFLQLQLFNLRRENNTDNILRKENAMKKAMSRGYNMKKQQISINAKVSSNTRNTNVNSNNNKDNNVDYTIVNNRMDRNKFSPSPGVDMTADGKFVIHPPLKYFNKD